MKQNKLIVAVSSDADRRMAIMRRLLIEHKFALTNPDAQKLIIRDVHSINIGKAYYIAADNFRFHESPITLQRLYQMSACGIFVLLGVRSLPRQYEFICEVYYE